MQVRESDRGTKWRSTGASLYLVVWLSSETVRSTACLQGNLSTQNLKDVFYPEVKSHLENRTDFAGPSEQLVNPSLSIDKMAGI